VHQHIKFQYYREMHIYHNFPESDISTIGDHLSVMMAKFALRMGRNCYFLGSGKSR